MIPDIGIVKVTVPAGTYWLGDPCYSVKDEDWDDWLDAAWAANNGTHDVMCAQVPGGFWVLGLGTAYGDGLYRDQHGNEYGVDAGMIGLVPVEYNPTTNYTLDDEGRNEYGATGIARKVTFENSVVCTNKNGVLRFGDIRIDTN